MNRFKTTLCAVALSLTISSSAVAGNIGGLRTNSTGNIGGLRSSSVGNIGGLRTNATGNIGGLRTDVTGTSVNDSQFNRQSLLSEGIFALIRVMLETGSFF